MSQRLRDSKRSNVAGVAGRGEARLQRCGDLGRKGFYLTSDGELSKGLSTDQFKQLQNKNAKKKICVWVC